MDREQERNDIENIETMDTNDSMVDVMVRIAKDLEKTLIGIWATTGLLALIAFLILLRLLLGR